MPTRCALVVLLYLFSLVAANAAPADPSFGELIARRVLALEPLGSGGHQGECMHVTIRNTSSGAVHTTLPPGWTFVSADTAIQDLILVREEAIALSPGASTTVTCRAFCCEASMGGPSAGERYSAGHQANERLTALASFINRGNYPDAAVQSAVWVLSDGHNISSISAVDRKNIQPLLNETSRLSGQKIPWYTTAYAPAEDDRLFSNEPAHISGQVQFDLPNNAMVSIVVQDVEHHTLRTFGKEHGYGPGHYDISVELTVKGWAHGHYDVCIIADGSNVVRRIPFGL